ncbi:type II toxin-antitoxin system toxin DNA ADP-ribosyl transferase DarT [Rufibacter tibetensis]|uniref:DarT domain-containing protein n=1 Tax=Rufibacter tibetensis TaxID=512763 RepID=A0A0N7HWG1_9BACT|nr:DUF4433 domain-containing protein [Rufibacter tibetensis]ALI99152.1 hypothetical protein DC20_09410 [Rufibacter tibetensis]
MSVIPAKKWLFRIIHIDNLEYILRYGIFNRYHPNADPNYINIGDSNLIEQRNNHQVGISPPGGELGEYIPFYFGPLSPMLYNIKTGHRGITKRPQTDIVYLCCKINDLVGSCGDWCFTDGHAKTAISEFYNSLDNLEKVDWEVVTQKWWNNTEDDFDRMRRKQAEFLVKNHVPVSTIGIIVVHDTERETQVNNMLKQLGLNIPVLVNPKKEFYY